MNVKWCEEEEDMAGGFYHVYIIQIPRLENQDVTFAIFC